MAQTEQDLKDRLPQNIDPDTIAVIGQDQRMFFRRAMTAAATAKRWGLINAYVCFDQYYNMLKGALQVLLIKFSYESRNIY